MWLTLCLKTWSLVAQASNLPVSGTSAPVVALPAVSPVPTSLPASSPFPATIPPQVGSPAYPQLVTPMSSGFHYFLLVIYFLICAGLIVAVLLQTTKSEGLTGIIGGQTQSIFRGKKSVEEKLNTVTNWLAVSFLVGSFLTFLIFRRL